MIKARVKETSITASTFDLDLDGAVSGFQSFMSAFGDGNICYYVIIDGTAWETGIGTVISGSPNRLLRDRVLESSAGYGVKLSLGSGTKFVFNDVLSDPFNNALGSPLNGIMNGTPQIWQRGTAFLAPTAAQIADRWSYLQSGTTAVVNVNRSTDVPTFAQSGQLFPYSIEVDVTTGDLSIAAADYAVLRHAIVGYDWQRYAQRTLTLSFWIRSTIFGTSSVGFSNGVDRRMAAVYGIQSADTWEYKTIKIVASPSAGTWNYASGKGIILDFALASGSNYFTSTSNVWESTSATITAFSNVNHLQTNSCFFRITGIELKVGDAPTPIKIPPFAMELEACKRFFQKSFNYDTVPVQNVGTLAGAYMFLAGKGGALAENGHSEVSSVPMNVTAPTTVFFNPSAANAQARDVTAAADCTATAVAANGQRSFAVSATGAAGTAVGNQLAVHWTRDAEP